MHGGKIWLGFLRTAVFVKGAILVSLLLLDVAEGKVQRAVSRVVLEESADNISGCFVLLMLHQAAGLNQSCRTGIAGLRWLELGERTQEFRSCASGTKLASYAWPRRE